MKTNMKLISPKLLIYITTFAAVFTCCHMSCATCYSISPIGLLFPEYEGYTRAYRVNDYGEVGGYSYSYGNNNYGHAFVWEQGQGLYDLGTYGGGMSYVNDMNNRLQLIGYQSNPSLSWIWDIGNGMRDFSDVSGAQVESVDAINNRGQVVGRTTTVDAFLWSLEEGFQEIIPLGQGTSPYVTGVNDYSQTCGGFSIGDYGTPQHAFFRDNGTGMLDLGTLDHRRSSSGTDINDLGQVVGHSWDRDGNSGWDRYNQKAFLWDETNGMQAIGAFHEDYDSFALAVNNRATVVGYGINDQWRDDPYAFVWTANEGFRDLREMVVEKNQWTRLAKAEDINQANQIAGWGYSQGEALGFLLTPVKEVSAEQPLELSLLLREQLLFSCWWEPATEPLGENEIFVAVEYDDGQSRQILGLISTRQSSEQWHQISLDIPLELQGRATPIRFRIYGEYIAEQPVLFLKDINGLPYTALDADRDGDCDGLDMAGFAVRYDKQVDSADINHDSYITGADLQMFANRLRAISLFP